MTGIAEEPARRTVAPFGRRLATVTASERIGAYWLLEAADAGGPTDPRPGQFYMLQTPVGWGAGDDERPYLPRAFSFARAVGGRLSFLLESVGPGTERLARLAVGETLWLTGPLGMGWAPRRRAGALLVGGGIGAAPLLCLQDELGAAAQVLLGFRSGAHAAAADLFTGASELATDDGGRGHHGNVGDLLRAALDEDQDVEVMACGPAAMLAAVHAMCAEHDVPAQLALEAGMACGYGACFGCVVPTRAGFLRLCVDGPVLDATLLAPDSFVHD